MPPLRNNPAPSTKPKLYQPPLLWTSYSETLALKMEMMKVIGAISPCQTPSQNPATLPSPSAVLASLLGPGAQERANNSKTRNIAAAAFFMFSSQGSRTLEAQGL